jgi:hypothetical protein
LIASASVAAIGFTVSLAFASLAHADGGPSDTGSRGDLSGVTDTTRPTADPAPPAIVDVIEVGLTPDGGTGLPEARASAAPADTGTATDSPPVSRLHAFEFPRLPKPAYASLLDTDLPRTLALAPDFAARTVRARSPLSEALPVPAPMPLETAAVRSSGSGGGIFQSLDDMAANLAGLLGGAGASNGSAAAGGISAAILVAVLVVAARLLMSLQWSSRAGVPEPLPAYILVPPG